MHRFKWSKNQYDFLTSELGWELDLYSDWFKSLESLYFLH